VCVCAQAQQKQRIHDSNIQAAAQAQRIVLVVLLVS
jgi:hypothetical protein